MPGRWNPQEEVWRRKVLARDGCKCMKCGSRYKLRLTVHHIKQWAKYPQLRYVVSNGITLCWACHKQMRGCEEGFELLCTRLLMKNNMKLQIGKLLAEEKLNE